MIDYCPRLCRNSTWFHYYYEKKPSSFCSPSWGMIPPKGVVFVTFQQWDPAFLAAKTAPSPLTWAIRRLVLIRLASVGRELMTGSFLIRDRAGGLGGGVLDSGTTGSGVRSVCPKGGSKFGLCGCSAEYGIHRSAAPATPALWKLKYQQQKTPQQKKIYEKIKYTADKDVANTEHRKKWRRLNKLCYRTDYTGAAFSCFISSWHDSARSFLSAFAIIFNKILLYCPPNGISEFLQKPCSFYCFTALRVESIITY